MYPAGYNRYYKQANQLPGVSVLDNLQVVQIRELAKEWIDDSFIQEVHSLIIDPK